LSGDFSLLLLQSNSSFSFFFAGSFFCVFHIDLREYGLTIVTGWMNGCEANNFVQERARRGKLLRWCGSKILRPQDWRRLPTYLLCGDWRGEWRRRVKLCHPFVKKEGYELVSKEKRISCLCPCHPVPLLSGKDCQFLLQLFLWM
jgi:hypothetical protein